MNRLDAIFASARNRHSLLIPYVCAGDPDAATTLQLLEAFGAMGVQAVEVGVPFSDPTGDGKSIAGAARRALEGGMTVARVLTLCAAAREAPAIVLFTYLNPIARYGLKQFAADARGAGVCGVIVADMPFEHRSEVAAAFSAAGIALTLLVAPTTPLERAALLVQSSDCFAYVVSRLGVTGTADKPQTGALIERLALLRARCTRPLAVGFGIDEPADARRLAPHADALVVGSGLVDAIAGRAQEAAVDAARQYLAPLIAACCVA